MQACCVHKTTCTSSMRSYSQLSVIYIYIYRIWEELFINQALKNCIEAQDSITDFF